VAKSTGRALYSIAAVSKLTGVSCHALRVWERRYGYPVPYRSPSGHRRYGVEQVHLLRRVAERLQAGESIGDVMAELRAGRLEVPGEEAAPPPGAAGESATSALIGRLAEGDLAGADEVYRCVAERSAPADLLDRLIEPALIEAGERWFRGDCDVFQEHGASGFLRGKLGELIDDARRTNPHPHHTALVGTVQGDRHEGGVLMLSVLLESAGWRAVPLGVDLPVREYQKAVEAWTPDALALSFVLSRNINKRFQELAKLRGVPIFVGGRSILNYQGLARRYGLIPLPGPASASVPLLLARFNQWSAESRRTTEA
jgi:methanogenic corrinoid protein MtbC1